MPPTPAPATRPRLWILGSLVLLLGVVMAAGGAVLVALGGSWYYLLAGVGMTVAGILLLRGRATGAWWFWAVLAATFAWTWWESGLDYWRWVPRMALPLALGIALAWRWPRLQAGPSVRAGRALAGVLSLGFLAALALAFVPHGVTRAERVPPAAPENPAVAAADDWPAYGRTHQAQRYWPHAGITRDNVAGLQRTWVYRTGDIPVQRWGAETTPLKVGDSLYLCSARNIVIALDARTGQERWRYDPQVPDEAIPYTAACRGVAYHQAAPAPAGGAAPACQARVITGTLDGRLVAVDARTGTPCADFGDNGQVDISVGMGESFPGYVSITSPPTIVRGVVVTGHQVLDGQRRDMPSGVIQGFDAITGELRWAWDMGRPGQAGRPPEGETYTRGTPNMWTIASGDEQLGHVYLPMGNAAADYWSGSRLPFEDEYSTSLVALDVTTGQPAWHFRTVHIDVWDYDLGSQATLVDFPAAGAGTVPALLLPTKQGDIYVLDRRTGQPLVAVEERPVPQGGVEPQRRTPTQPFSRYHTLRKPDLTERDMWGMTPVDQLFCRIAFRRSSYEGIYTPPTSDRYWVQYPGYNGGSDWGGIAVDPRRGIIIANYNDMPNHNRLVPREEARRKGWAPRDEGVDPDGPKADGDPQDGTPYAVEVNAGWRVPFTRLLCKQPPYGGIRAIELASGRTLWDWPFGTARGNGPFGIRSGLPVLIGTPNNAGPVITAGGLVFIAAATDDLIRAIDVETGETVWQDALPAGGQATPMMYSIDGRQYLVVMAGGHHFMETPPGDHVIAYALPEE